VPLLRRITRKRLSSLPSIARFSLLLSEYKKVVLRGHRTPSPPPLFPFLFFRGVAPLISLLFFPALGSSFQPPSLAVSECFFLFLPGMALFNRHSFPPPRPILSLRLDFFQSQFSVVYIIRPPFPGKVVLLSPPPRNRRPLPSRSPFVHMP